MKLFKLLPLLFCLLLFSCDDGNIANKMVGTWERTYTVPYRDGTKVNIKEQITFKLSHGETQSGNFTEYLEGLETVDEDGFSGSFRWKCKISGRWKVSLEELFQHYDLNSLVVSIDSKDMNVRCKDPWMAAYTSKKDIIEALQKDVYSEMFDSYEDLNDQDVEVLGYPDVEVNNNELSYRTADQGRFVFRKIRK